MGDPSSLDRIVCLFCFLSVTGTIQGCPAGVRKRPLSGLNIRHGKTTHEELQDKMNLDNRRNINLVPSESSFTSSRCDGSLKVSQMTARLRAFSSDAGKR